MTPSSSRLVFPPFHLEVLTGQLWHEKQRLRLRPQAVAVLQYLLEHSQQVISKTELLTALWPGVTVSGSVLKTYIWEIRRALQGYHPAPLIETIPRRGYRFIGTVAASAAPSVQSSKFKVQSFPTTQSAIRNPQSAMALVGREAELTQLHHWLDKAVNGERQVVFVTGEAGIGKTTFVEAFLQRLDVEQVQSLRPKAQGPSFEPIPNLQPSASSLSIARGQCIEQYGTSEAYLPMLEALGRLCRTTRRQQAIPLLRQYAPTWLLQLPAFLDPAEREQLQREVNGVTRDRMLREMAEALEALTAERPLVLCLEDLHWSDSSTLDLMAFVARRYEPARLLVIGTYRPVEMLRKDHPLKAVTEELFLHQQGKELPLGLLTQDAVEIYLATRLSGETPGSLPLRRVAQAVYQRTEGHPFFMVNVVDDLLTSTEEQPAVISFSPQEILSVVPPSVRQVIEKQFARLTPGEQRLLEAASIAGMSFSAAAVGAATETEVIEVETRCESLVQRRLFLQASGNRVATERRLSERYQFSHSLYRDVVSAHITAAHQRLLHARIGEWKEAAYGTQARIIAAELAMHFERGRDLQRAIYYLRQAGENATRRSAHREAVNLFTKGLELLHALPPTPERTRQEIRLHLALGLPLTILKGYASPDVERSYTRARHLCQQIGETRYLFPAVLGLGGVRQNQAEFRKARVLARQLLRLARTEGDPARLLWAYVLSGQISYLIGEFALAQKDFVEGIALYDIRRHSPHASDVVQDPGIHCRCYLAEILWVQGYVDQARQLCHEALRLARQLAHSHSKAVALSSAVLLHNRLGEQQTAQDLAEELIALTHQQGFPFWLAVGTVRRGWALVAQGEEEQGLAQMRQGLAIFHTTGAKFAIPSFLCDLAEAHERAGRVEEGLALVTEALGMIAKTGERVSEAELYRLKGQLTLQKLSAVSCRLSVPNTQSPTSKAQSEAEACFLKAVEIARRQQAKSLELRATTSLARLWQRQGKHHAARNTLSEIYSWFTEGFTTADLREARALLEE
jgi:DNA-binding winged helix-turn-helix (wHTH) protein/predicted ATPase